MNVRVDNVCHVVIETELNCTKNGIEKGLFIRMLSIFLSSNPTIINFLSTFCNNFWLLNELGKNDGMIERRTDFNQGQGGNHEEGEHLMGITYGGLQSDTCTQRQSHQVTWRQTQSLLIVFFSTTALESEHHDLP